MTIRQKLSLGFGLVIVTFVGLGSLSVISLYSVSKMGEKVYDQAHMVGTFSQSATARYFKIKALFESARRLDEDARDEILEVIEAEHLGLKEDLGVVQIRTLDAHTEEQTSSLIQDIHVWVNGKGQFLEEVSEAPGLAEPESIQGQTLRIENNLSSLGTFATESGFVVRVEIEEQGQSLLYLMLTLTLFGVLSAIGIGWLTASPIVRRLYQVDSLLAHAVKGYVDDRTDFTQRDELSRIGTHLNLLLDTVGDAIGGVCQTAERVSEDAIRASTGTRGHSDSITEQAGSVKSTPN